MSNSLPHCGLQHARLSCPLLPPEICSNSIVSMTLSNHLIPLCPLLLLPSIFASIRVFSNELALHISWPKYWSFNFSISLSNEYSGLISFRIDWFDLLAVQGTLKNFLQYHILKASIIQHSTFFMVRKTSGFLSRETGISGNFVGRIKGAKCPFDLQFLTWDFS